jgi:hypothetical protein
MLLFYASVSDHYGYYLAEPNTGEAEILAPLTCNECEWIIPGTVQ